jgi:hypothetical protein
MLVSRDGIPRKTEWYYDESGYYGYVMANGERAEEPIVVGLML